LIHQYFITDSASVAAETHRKVSEPGSITALL